MRLSLVYNPPKTLLFFPKIYEFLEVLALDRSGQIKSEYALSETKKIGNANLKIPAFLRTVKY